MPAERRVGMDHDHYAWWPLVNRGVLRWPDNSRVALCVIVNLDHLDWHPPEGSYQPPNLAGGLTSRGLPDYTKYSHRDYGLRVGVFRVLDVLAKHGIPATVAMDQLTAENYPYLVRYCLERGCEIIGHGVAAGRMITSKMAEEEEREYILASIASLRRVTGVDPMGWMSPEYGESAVTPQLLARAGISYVCDWVNDEQPYPMTTPEGTLHALPVMIELDDCNALWDRRVPVNKYGDMLTESFDRLYQDGEATGRLLALNLHPWLIGQPFRIKYLDKALGHMAGHSGVWKATGREIIDWYTEHPPGN